MQYQNKKLNNVDEMIRNMGKKLKIMVEKLSNEAKPEKKKQTKVKDMEESVQSYNYQQRTSSTNKSQQRNQFLR